MINTCILHCIFLYDHTKYIWILLLIMCIHHNDLLILYCAICNFLINWPDLCVRVFFSFLLSQSTKDNILMNRSHAKKIRFWSSDKGKQTFPRSNLNNLSKWRSQKAIHKIRECSQHAWIKNHCKWFLTKNQIPFSFSNLGAEWSLV